MDSNSSADTPHVREGDTEDGTAGSSGRTTRRTFLTLTGAAGLAAGGAFIGYAQPAEIALDGDKGGWVGRSPEDIAGSTNPTLQLQPGESYTVTWTNVDGASHNFAILDENGSSILSSPITDEEGQTQSVEFEATDEMATYVCEVHPESMRGRIETSGDETQMETGRPISEAFSAGQLGGDRQVPEPIETTATGATLFGLAESGDELYYALLLADAEGVTQSHIHVGGSDETGDVVAFLFGATDEADEFTGPLENGITGNGLVAEGTITEEDLVGPYEDRSLDDLLDDLRDDEAYVNVHTEEHPAGEIRGQIGSVDTVTVTFSEEVTATTADEKLLVETSTTLDVSDGPPSSTDEPTDAADDDDQRGTTEGNIDLSYSGTVAPGNEVTITATRGGSPVADADVYVKDGDGDRRLVGQTDDDGRIVVKVPASGDRAGELNVKVRKGELEGELEVEDDD